MTRPLLPTQYHLPDDDAPMIEWLRPHSSLLNSRIDAWSSLDFADGKRGGNARGNGSKCLKINRIIAQRRRNGA